MAIQIEVENIKCGGCANTIRNRLLEQADVSEVQVDIKSGQVAITGSEERRDDYAAILASLGYPETGTVEGIRAAGAKAKSFVSCAVGRIGDSD